MRKKDLITVVASSAMLKKKDASKVVNVVFDTIKQTLAEGETVQLVGFGKFEIRHRMERNGRIFSTGEVIRVGEKRVPAFKSGKRLKERVNQPNRHQPEEAVRQLEG